jgi:hypothetical protein
MHSVRLLASRIFHIEIWMIKRQVRMEQDHVRHRIQWQSALCASLLDQPGVHSKLMRFYSSLLNTNIVRTAFKIDIIKFLVLD